MDNPVVPDNEDSDNVNDAPVNLGEIVPLNPASISARGHIVVVETVYHQSAVDQPTAIQASFERFIDGEAQSYGRRMKVGEEWQQLAPNCWLEQVSMLVVENKGTKFVDVAPTLEARDEAAKKILDIVFHSSGTPDSNIAGHVKIMPGESSRFQPNDHRVMFIRSRSGTASYVVTLHPD